MTALFRKPAAWALRMARARMADWMLAAILLLAVVALIAPQQLGVTVYKMSLIALAAVAGYWVDRSAFPYARPDTFFDDAEGGIPTPESTFTSLRGVVTFTEGAVTRQALDAPQLVRLARTAMLRRALIMAAAMLAMSVGA